MVLPSCGDGREKGSDVRFINLLEGSEKMVSLVEEQLRRLEEKGISLTGCSEEEITRLETVYSIKLPKAYKEFLSIIGKSENVFAGILFSYSDLIGSPDFDRLGEQAEGIVEISETKFKLLKTWFVFSMNDQIYNFVFLKTEEGEDPPVYLYYEGNEEEETVLPSFSEWVKLLVSDELRDLGFD